MIYKKLLILLMVSFAYFSWSQTPTVTTECFSIGETLIFKSALLKEDRVLNIYLPDSYSTEADKKYPVIYLLDGSRDEDFIHIAGIVQFCSFSWIEIIPETIVVGIANVDRRRDFTYPTTVAQDKIDFPTTGGSAHFIDFLENEVKPLIATRYRTEGEETLIGQSLGGLLATEILFKKPGLFDNYVIVSPSLWWDNQSLLNYDLPVLSGKKVYVGVGKEGEVMEEVAKKLAEKLQAEMTGPVHFRFYPEKNHGDALHIAAYESFELLFKKEN